MQGLIPPCSQLDMKKAFLLFCMLAGCCRMLAQSDSLALIDSHWNRVKIMRGVWWKSTHLIGGQFFHSNQNISIIEISRRVKRARLEIAYSDSLETTSQLAKRGKALAAINGSFFKMRGPDPDHSSTSARVLERSKMDRNRSVVYLKVNDSMISKNIPDKDSIRKRHQQGSIAILGARLSILKGDSINLNSEQAIVADDVLSTGPIMLLKGKDQAIPNDAFCNDRHPRTAVGTKKDGTVLLFVVDGRNPASAGMSIIELQKTLRWLGCTDAINLDGGGSTTMFVKGQPYNGVVNYPTDNKKFDHEGEREVANAILLLRK